MERDILARVAGAKEEEGSGHGPEHGHGHVYVALDQSLQRAVSGLALGCLGSRLFSTMSAKSAFSHFMAFTLGIGFGFLLASKCPPTPVPTAQPPIPAPPKVEEPSKSEPKIEIKIEPKSETKNGPVA